MANHPTRDDIDLLDGGFYVGDPREKYAWMRANAPVYFDEKNGVWGVAELRGDPRRREGLQDVLERGRQPARPLRRSR